VVVAEQDKLRVLVVEDDLEVAGAIARKLEGSDHTVETTADPLWVTTRLDLRESAWDVVLLDVNLPGMSGIELLERFRQTGSLASVIMLTGDDSARTATACMRAGAFYYLTKPFRPVELMAIVESAGRYARLRAHSAQRESGDDSTDKLLIGVSAPIRTLRSGIARLAKQDVSILIRGESGTGKELIARALHERGTRAGRPFIALNCGAIPDTLIDSELFGHAKGSFTGATTERPGVFVEADKGTLFLDEIGDMPMAVQGRLLRVLQEGEVRPVGSTGIRQVDVRVVAATNVDLEAAVAEGRFRQDLLFRLNVVSLPVAPLRERLDDLPLLATHFLKKHSKELIALTSEALEALNAYKWPGNVRELENAMQFAIAMRTGNEVGAESLPETIAPRAKAMRPMFLSDGEDIVSLAEGKKRAANIFERDYLTRVMWIAKGSISEAARLAGIDRTNFRRLLQRHEIDATGFK
jgi:two-component system response regulator HydG